MAGINDPSAFAQFLAPGVTYNYGLNYTSGVDPTALAVPAIQSYVQNEIPNFGYSDVINQRLTYAATPTTIKDGAGNTVAKVDGGTPLGQRILSSLGLGSGSNALKSIYNNNPIVGPNSIPAKEITALQNFTLGTAAAVVVGIVLIGVGAYSLITSQSFSRGVSNVKGVAALAA